MDNFTALIKNLLIKINNNSTDYGTVKMSDLDISFLSTPQYSSTIKSTSSTYNPHLTKNKSLNSLPNSGRNLPRNRHSSIDLPQFDGKERNHVPVMGRNALLVKSQRDKHESMIVHDLVVEKFNNILNYYYTRSLKRRSSRNRDSETMSCCTPNSLWDDEDGFNFLKSADNVSRPSSVSTGYENDFSEYDVSKFLREALGDELDACLDDLTRNEEESSIDSNLTMLLSKTTQMNPNTTCMSTVNCDREKISAQINAQEQIMQQTTKALTFCESTKEFFCSAEQVECEKILLIASLRKQLLVECLNRNAMKTTNEKSCFGCVELNNIHFPLKSGLSIEKDFLNYYLIAVKCENVLYTSELVDEINCINFAQRFRFDDLQSNFVIELRIYCIRLKNNAKHYSHETKFHLNRNTCPSPKKLFHKNHKYKVVKGGGEGIRESMFKLQGECVLNVDNLRNEETFELMNIKSGRLMGHFTLQSKIDVNLVESISGFLTIALQRDSYPIWNRRWCLLEGHTIKYWNYPVEENVLEALQVIDLKQCTVREVNAVDRAVCARGKTILLPIKNENYFLSADALNEFNEWKMRINFVLNSLYKWNCMNM